MSLGADPKSQCLEVFDAEVYELTPSPVRPLDAPVYELTPSPVRRAPRRCAAEAERGWVLLREGGPQTTIGNFLLPVGKALRSFR